uniref:Ovule protein n=1 Tax=Echinostoma caproni TaxID=27848 RepID=A0A183A407_9TREM
LNAGRSTSKHSLAGHQRQLFTQLLRRTSHGLSQQTHLLRWKSVRRSKPWDVTKRRAPMAFLLLYLKIVE